MVSINTENAYEMAKSKEKLMSYWTSLNHDMQNLNKIQELKKCFTAKKKSWNQSSRPLKTDPSHIMKISTDHTNHQMASLNF